MLACNSFECSPSSRISPRTRTRRPVASTETNDLMTDFIAIGLALYASFKMATPFWPFTHCVRFFVNSKFAKADTMSESGTSNVRAISIAKSAFETLYAPRTGKVTATVSVGVTNSNAVWSEYSSIFLAESSLLPSPTVTILKAAGFSACEIPAVINSSCAG